MKRNAHSRDYLYSKGARVAQKVLTDGSSTYDVLMPATRDGHRTLTRFFMVDEASAISLCKILNTQVVDVHAIVK